MGGGGGYEPDTYASEMQGKISREQYEDYKQYYGPIEDETIAYLTDDKRQQGEVTEAGDLAGKAFDSTSAASRRNMGRYGISASKEVTANLAKDSARDKALAQVGAKNTMRDVIDQRKTALSEEMIGIGKGIKSDYEKSMGAWTQMEGMHNQQKASDAASSAANRNAMIGTGVSIAMTAAMFF